MDDYNKGDNDRNGMLCFGIQLACGWMKILWSTFIFRWFYLVIG